MKTLRKENPDLQQSISLKLEDVHWHGDKYFSSLCPYHQDTRPSFFVYADGFRCASCGEWGSLDKLASYLSNGKIRFVREDEKINEKPEWSLYAERHGGYEGAARYAYKVGKEFPVLMKYLKERKLDDMITPCRLGYIDGWLSFPVFDEDNNFVDWVLRKTPNKETDVKYAIRPRKNKKDLANFYSASWDAISQSDYVLVPFGILDMLTLHKVGFPTLTGITGKSYIPSSFEHIRKPLIIIPDLGEETSGYLLARQLGWRGKVLRLNYPDGTKDVNDILMKFGESAVKSLIEEQL